MFYCLGASLISYSVAWVANFVKALRSCSFWYPELSPVLLFTFMMIVDWIPCQIPSGVQKYCDISATFCRVTKVMTAFFSTVWSFKLVAALKQVVLNPSPSSPIPSIPLFPHEVFVKVIRATSAATSQTWEQCTQCCHLWEPGLDQKMLCCWRGQRSPLH